MPLHKRIAAAVLVMVAVNYAQQHGWSLSSFVPGVAEPLLVEAEGFHAILLRSESDTPTKGQAAVLGSQDVEDAATAGGGDYEVYWTDETPAAAHQKAVDGLEPHGTPSWYLADSKTRKSTIGPVPESTDAALAAIAEVRGTAK